MKKTLLLLASAALLFAGCAKEQIAGGEADGNEVTVTFTAGLTPEGTKAVIDQDGAAKKVNHWIMRVYDAEGALFIEDERDVTAGSDAALVQTFELKLFKNQTYDLLFWADTKGAYNTGDLTAVSKRGLTANADSFDAFSAHVSYQSLSSEAKNVTLTRPFAQLNIITNDLAALKAKVKADAYSKYAPSDFQLLATVPTTFNVKTQTAGTATEQTLTATASYGSFAEPDPAGTTLFMDYIFASKDEADVLDLAFGFKSNLQEISYDFTAIPLQRNYRTNIKGQLMSNNSDWTVTIDPDWDSQADGSDDYNVVYYQASSIEAANSYIGSQNDEQTKTVDLTNAEVKSTDVNADGTIHFILKKTSPKDLVSFMLPEIPSDLASAGCTGWTIEYEQDYPTKNVEVSAPTGTNVIILAPTSHVVLNGQTYGDIEARTGYGTLVVPQGVTINNLTVKKGWVEIHGTVITLNPIDPAAGESVYFCACEGLSQEVFAKIKSEGFSYIHPSYVERQNGDKWDIVPSENPGDGSRKVSLAGSPFKAGDVIKISNGVVEPVDCTVEEDEQGNILIKTNLMGSLTAVYPASAAKLNGNAIEGANIPATQSGKLADAQIYKATISAGSTKATFESQTSILKFYVDETIGVKSVSVTSAEDLASGGAKTVTVDPSGEQTIDNVTDDPAKRICYVAVLPGEKSSLTYSSATTTQGSVSRTLSSGATLAAGQEYEAFIPYYIDLGTAGLWGYCNVGAFLPEEYGRYFAWADVEGQTWNGSSWSGGGFSTTPTFDGEQGNLPLAKDAANVAWGGKWTLPAKAQIDALNGLGEALVWDDAKKGYVVSDNLFLPAAGGGGGTQFEGLGETGAYWSSSYGQFQNQQSVTTGYYALYFDAGYYISGGHSVKPVGISVRPVMASPLTQVTLNKESITDLEVGSTETLTCTLTPAIAAIKSISWTSSDNSVATVSDGKVTGVSAGASTITVTVKDQYDNQKTATCSVTVKEPYHPVTGLSLDFESATILKGKTKTLSATATPENATEKGVTWTSSNASVATVSDAGVVTAVSTGSATITATSKDNAQKTATCSVTVKELPAGALSGAFSVSDTKQVYFSKGNLWYNSGTSTFSFENTQYASSEALNKNHLDVFRHAESIADATTVLTNKEIKIGACIFDFQNVKGNILFTNSSATAVNSNFTVGGVKGKYRALSKAEWEYLFARAGGKLLRKWVKIDGKYLGFVMAPDDYTGEIKSTYSLAEWAAAEKDGLVLIAHANVYSFPMLQYGNDDGIIKFVGDFSNSFSHNDSALYWGSDLSRMSYYADNTSAYYTDPPEMYSITEGQIFNSYYPIRLVTEL